MGWLVKFVNRWVSINREHNVVFSSVDKAKDTRPTTNGQSKNITNNRIKTRYPGRRRFDIDERTTSTTTTADSNTVATWNDQELSTEEIRSMYPNGAGEDPINIDIHDLVFKKRIGAGASGTTYLGRLKLPCCDETAKRSVKVAIKVTAMTESGLANWDSEKSILHSLSRTHPNIVAFYGLSILTETEHPERASTRCLVMQYCEGGDLSKALTYETPPGFVIRVARGLATGVAFLHQQLVLHRDIKPENILLHGDVRGDFSVKLADFGLSKCLKEGETEHEHSAETGTYRYMAPEVLRHKPYGHPADVFSFTVTLWRLLSRQNPFHGRGEIEAASQVIQGDRPPLPKDIPAMFVNLITDGWTQDPTQRITIFEIKETLLSSSLTSEERRWMDSPIGHPVYEA